MTCPVGTDVRQAAAILENGGVVAFPTETVYGLGALYSDHHAVARVFAVKNRPRFDPLIVHIARRDALEQLAPNVPAEAEQLASRFWPGPLTLVLPKAACVPDLVTAGLPSFAVRMPDDSLARELLEAVSQPVAAPSANRFGRVSPTTAEHVAEQLGGQIDFILDGGPCRIGVESTIVQFAESGPRLLRPGGIALEEIEAVLGPVAVGQADGREESAPAAPGGLPRHYAPQTPIQITEDVEKLAGEERFGLLAWRAPADTTPFAAVEVLSATGDLTEAAANFFAALHRLDASGVERILAEPFPERGLGRALNDRLRRAAHPSH